MVLDVFGGLWRSLKIFEGFWRFLEVCGWLHDELQGLGGLEVFGFWDGFIGFWRCLEVLGWLHNELQGFGGVGGLEVLFVLGFWEVVGWF